MLEAISLFYEENKEAIHKYGKWLLIVLAVAGAILFATNKGKQYYNRSESEKATQRTAQRAAADRAEQQTSDNNFHELRGQGQQQQTQSQQDSAAYENLVRHPVPKPSLPARR